MLLKRGRTQTNSIPRTSFLKKLFWTYFLLLIFEGALRKWFIPQLSAPLLLVRDPIALLIIGEAYRTRKWPRQWSAVTGILTAAIIALCLIQLVAGDNPWVVELYGLRSYLLPFPVAFIMGETLDDEDLRKFGNCTLWLLLPLTALEVTQYLAPRGSILNAGAYEGFEQLAYAGDHVRASATFSFVTGPTSYVPLATAFIFYGVVRDRFAKKWLLALATCGVIIAIPVTGSRGLVIILMLTLGFVVAAAMFGLSQLMSSLKIVFALLVVVLVVSELPVFSNAVDTFEERLNSSSEGEGGARGTIEKRIISPIVDPLESSFSSRHWFGDGIGLGSNVAAKIMTGTPEFLTGEGEFARVLFEFGPAFGIAFMLFRVLLAIALAAKALSDLREGRPLAWFLVPSTLVLLLVGTLEQPTIQGFMVVTLGFLLAALNRTRTPDELETFFVSPSSRKYLS